MAPFRMARAPPRTARDPPYFIPLAGAHDSDSLPKILSGVFLSIVTYREEACDDGVPWIFLLSYSFDRAVKRAEEPAPDAKISS